MCCNERELIFLRRHEGTFLFDKEIDIRISASASWRKLYKFLLVLELVWNNFMHQREELDCDSYMLFKDKLSRFNIAYKDKIQSLPLLLLGKSIPIAIKWPSNNLSEVLNNTQNLIEDFCERISAHPLKWTHTISSGKPPCIVNSDEGEKSK